MSESFFDEITEDPDITEIDPGETSGGEWESGAGESGEDPEQPLTSDPDDTERPPAETGEPTQTIGDIVFITPDGPIVIYADSGSDEHADLVARAESAWVDKYGAMDKPLHNYSVSEALLFIIACGTVVSLLCKLFKRRKL